MATGTGGVAEDASEEVEVPVIEAATSSLVAFSMEATAADEGALVALAPCDLELVPLIPKEKDVMLAPRLDSAISRIFFWAVPAPLVNCFLILLKFFFKSLEEGNTC